MKDMKRVLALGLTLAMALTACTGTKDPEQGGEDEAAKPITNFIDWALQSNEMETFMLLHSEEAVNGRVLQNCWEGLLTRDEHARVIPQIATEWEPAEDMMSWTFKLRDDVVWVDVNGEKKADLTAWDFLTGCEWVLNYYKNDAKNVSMLSELLDGAQEYYDWTKSLSQEEAFALTYENEKFQELVGIEATDDYTLVYQTTKAAPYFDTVIMGTCGLPLSQAQVDEMGVEGVKGQNNLNMWYNGPYTITEYNQGSSKVFTKNPAYYNPDIVSFETVEVKMVEDGNRDDDLFMMGEIDRCDLSEARLRQIYDSKEGDTYYEWKDNLVQVRASAANYGLMFNYNKLFEDGTPDTNWNAAIANEAFRLSIRYGVDFTRFWSRYDFINPASNRAETFTTAELVVFSDGTDYIDRVKELTGTTDGRFDADKGQQYVAQAKEELAAKGVTFPIEMDYYVKAGDQTAYDNGVVLQELFEGLSENYIKFNIKTYVSNQTQEVLNLHLHSFALNGWIADYSDPENFLNQLVINNDNAYYANRVMFTNDATDPDFIAMAQEYTNLAAKANAIVDDLDARYQAQAEAEAFMLEHGMIVPVRSNTAWSMTKVNTYSHPRGSTKYVRYETSEVPYTVEDYERFQAEYNAAN